MQTYINNDNNKKYWKLIYYFNKATYLPTQFELF